MAIDFQSRPAVSEVLDDTRSNASVNEDQFQSIVDRVVTGAGRDGLFEWAFGPGS
jgi:hypothetical protein